MVPKVHPALNLEKWLAQPTDELKLTLDPWAKDTIKTLTPVPALRLVIGPEGGFSDREVSLTTSAGFTAVQFRPGRCGLKQPP